MPQSAPISQVENPRNCIFQANSLIQARKNFNLVEMRIFLLGLSGINPHLSHNDRLFDENFKPMFVPTARLVELFGGNTKRLRDIKTACNSLPDATIELRQADGGTTLSNLFNRLDYIPKTGLSLQFGDVLRPFILDLTKSNGFTRLNFSQLFSLSSTYSIRLLELLLQYQNIAPFRQNRLISRTMSVPEIRFALNVPADAYQARTDNFRKIVLDNHIREINAKTAFVIRYEPLKSGRILDKFRFLLDTSALNSDLASPNLDITSNFAISRLREIGFSEKTANAILDRCESPADCLRRLAAAKRAVSAQNRRGGVQNVLGYIRCHIEQNWTSRGADSPTTPPPLAAPARTVATTHDSKVAAGTAPPLPDSLVSLIKAAIARGDAEKSIELLLESRGLTIEIFKGLYLNSE